MNIESAVDVNGFLCAPLCKFGTDGGCSIYIKKDKLGLSHMYVSVLQTVDGQTSKYTYEMRSIIEAIQELNRRTATFNCTVAFTTANPNHGLPSKTNDIQGTV